MASSNFNDDMHIDVNTMTAAEKKRLHLPTCCEGAASFLCACCSWSCLCCIVPAALYIFLRSEVFDAYAKGLWILFALCLSIGLLICYCAVHHVIWQGIICPPKAPPFIPALSQSPTHRISVRCILLIYNPNAGNRKAGDVCNNMIVPALRERGIVCEAVPTERVMHARDLAAECDLSRFDALACMGGDGTFHEMVNGMMSRTDGRRVPVVIIPCGSSNGVGATLRQNMSRLGKEIPIYEELDDIMKWSVDRVASGQVAQMDVFQVETSGRQLVGIHAVCLGMFGEVDLLAEDYRWMGAARMDLISVWSVLKKKLSKFSFCIKWPDGTEEDDTVLALGLSLILSQHWSDTMRASPNSQLDDGVAEMLCLSGGSIGRILSLFLQLESGAHVYADDVWASQPFTSVSFAFDDPGVVMVDGEYFKHDGRLDVRVIKQGLDILVCDDDLRLPGGPHV